MAVPDIPPVLERVLLLPLPPGVSVMGEGVQVLLRRIEVRSALILYEAVRSQNSETWLSTRMLSNPQGALADNVRGPGEYRLELRVGPDPALGEVLHGVFGTRP